MTPKERFLTVLKGGIPDCVPASPDMSNMIPCKMTGRPLDSVRCWIAGRFSAGVGPGAGGAQAGALG